MLPYPILPNPKCKECFCQLNVFKTGYEYFSLHENRYEVRQKTLLPAKALYIR